ncbi:uncharacterized protein LOC128233515 isoform X2 [Mya arenaria]|uniref:uncharacterized protein LOC128233515 isoform X2 n=1 Tax=Mya arenaria TaxID=6604 RepID=UPI0022E146BA|nr:uncharacterized protein LOC128233515 isoform X2 [Mya arenaria]
MFVVHFICIVGAWSSTKVLAANQDYMKNIISNYFSQPRHHEADLDYKNRSRDLIFSEFKRLGLETTVQNFSQEKVTFSNVIGVSRGFRIGKKDDKIVAVGAHYDTTQNSSGVDDNGSGMAAMFEVARQIDEHRQKGEQINNTVIFMAFDLEEGVHIGSNMTIYRWLLPWLVKTYGRETALALRPNGIIILDGLMNFNSSARSQTFQVEVAAMFPNMSSTNMSGNFLALTYSSDQPNSSLTYTLANNWAVHSDASKYHLHKFGLLNSYSNPYVSRFLKSTSASNFWMDKIPAIVLHDTGNYRGDLTECPSCDDKRMLTEGNLMFLDHVVDVIGKTVFNLSEIHMPAAENDGMGTHPSSAPRAVSTMVLVHAMMLLIYD